MKNYKLNYERLTSFQFELTDNTEIIEKEFSSYGKRSSFIADQLIGNSPKRVFAMIIHWQSDSDDLCEDVYVFEHFLSVQDLINQRWALITIKEFRSFEDGYDFALKYKEPSLLCYNKK
jgi:hypothetical protein